VNTEWPLKRAGEEEYQGIERLRLGSHGDLAPDRQML